MFFLTHERVFTALHAMQTLSSDEKAVRPSVCASVCQTRGLWQDGRKICPDFYTIWKNKMNTVRCL